MKPRTLSHWPLASLLCLAAAWAGEASAQLPSAPQEMAARLAWFDGRSPLVTDTGRREPTAEQLAALEAARPRLVPPGSLDPDGLDPQQGAARLEAARTLTGTTAERRALQNVAARRGAPPELRAAAAVALSTVRSDLAPAALAFALPDVADPALRHFVAAEALLALRRSEAGPALSAIDRQALYLARRIAASVACEDSEVWASFGRLGRDLEGAKDPARVATILREARLPAACLERFVLELSKLPLQSLPPQGQVLLLRRAERQLSIALLAGDRLPGGAARAALGAWVEPLLVASAGPRVLAHATGLVRLAGIAQMRPKLEALLAATPTPSLEPMLEATLSELAAPQAAP